jgi:serine/threonine protein phosphatase PrpC
MLSDEELWQGAMSSKSLSESCDRLVRQANQAGGKDNLTIVLIELVVT